MVRRSATLGTSPRNALPSDSLGSYAADPVSTVAPAASLRCPESAGGGGTVSSCADGHRRGSNVAHRPPFGQGVRRRLIPIELVLPRQVGETAVVDRLIHSRG
jgi:hypothetical protein